MKAIEEERINSEISSIIWLRGRYIEEEEKRRQKIFWSESQNVIKWLWLITERKLFIFLSKKVWFFETSDDDDDGVEAFLSNVLCSPKRFNGSFSFFFIQKNYFFPKFFFVVSKWCVLYVILIWRKNEIKKKIYKNKLMTTISIVMLGAWK